MKCLHLTLVFPFILTCYFALAEQISIKPLNQGEMFFVSNEKIPFQDANGNVYLETLSDRSIFFTKLKPGRYCVTVDGKENIANKQRTLSGAKHILMPLIWPQPKSSM